MLFCIGGFNKVLLVGLTSRGALHGNNWWPQGKFWVCQRFFVWLGMWVMCGVIISGDGGETYTIIIYSADLLERALLLCIHVERPLLPHLDRPQNFFWKLSLSLDVALSIFSCNLLQFSK